MLVFSDLKGDIYICQGEYFWLWGNLPRINSLAKFNSVVYAATDYGLYSIDILHEKRLIYDKPVSKVVYDEDVWFLDEDKTLYTYDNEFSDYCYQVDDFDVIDEKATVGELVVGNIVITGDKSFELGDYSVTFRDKILNGTSNGSSYVFNFGHYLYRYDGVSMVRQNLSFLAKQVCYSPELYIASNTGLYNANQRLLFEGDIRVLGKCS